MPLVRDGHDTSGPTANRPTNAEIGAHFFDTTTLQDLVWNGTVWQRAGESGGATPTLIPGDLAIPPHLASSYLVTKGSASALTLAAPTAGAPGTGDDGNVISIYSTTAFAHVLTATGLLQTGSANVNVATFAAFAGAGLTLKAYNGKWIVTASTGITFT